MMPRSKVVNESVEGICKLHFKGAHEFHINSLNLNSDGETFLSADDLRINIWNLNDNKTVYNVLDVKPKSVTDIEEAITHAEFHPKIPSLFQYSTSKGVVNVCDFRDRATFQGGSSLKFEIGLGAKKNAFTDIINCISKAKFIPSADNIVATRDYLSVKLWDIRSTQ
jgi:serine/threonine-protein phosphatase 2A regulatory subunit B